MSFGVAALVIRWSLSDISGTVRYVSVSPALLRCSAHVEPACGCHTQVDVWRSSQYLIVPHSALRQNWTDLELVIAACFGTSHCYSVRSVWSLLTRRNIFFLKSCGNRILHGGKRTVFCFIREIGQSSASTVYDAAVGSGISLNKF